MIIDKNFFKQTHSFFKDISKEYLLPNLGNLKKDEIVDLEDNRWLYKELGDDIVTNYEELELDHLSFLLVVLG